MSDAPQTQEELLVLRKEAEAELMKYPGVFGVGLGVKERGGDLTDEIAFRVYVDEKKAPGQLRPEEMIPREYKGIPTDVLLKRKTTQIDCEDHQQHSPLVGGITISTLKPDSVGNVSLGTLGFFATINGGAAPHNIALVTNRHVVSHNSEAIGDTVYQPAWVSQPGGTFAPLLGGGDAVGTILALPVKGDHPFTYPGRALDNYYVDAASVKLDICISSWCHTNCGTSFANEVQSLALNGSNALVDVAEAQATDVGVVKVGRTTGRTVGRITDIVAPVINADGVNVHNCIEIKVTQMSTADNCGGTFRFTDEGDSGSALVNAQGKLIGLIFGGNPADSTLGYACHILPVLDALALAAITTANPVHGNPAASGMSAEIAMVDGRPNQTAALRARFLGSPEGQRISAVIERHRHEVIHLVNNNRRVAVIWRRNQGPAFLNRAINNIRDPEIEIPWEIEGVVRTALFQNMARVLTEHGSPELCNAIAEHREDLLLYCSAFNSLHHVVDQLCERQLV